jgi:tripartite-type tricarboxylate transporter receptor subunit TctC
MNGTSATTGRRTRSWILVRDRGVVPENGIYVLAGTPDAIVRRVQQEIAKALQAPDITEDALTNGYVLGGETPADFATFMKADRERWQKIIREANIKLQ